MVEGLEWDKWSVLNRWHEAGTWDDGIVFWNVGGPAGQIGVRNDYRATWNFNDDVVGNWPLDWGDIRTAGDEQGGRTFEWFTLDRGSTIRAYQFDADTYKRVMRFDISVTEIFEVQATHYFYATGSPHQTTPWWTNSDEPGFQLGNVHPVNRDEIGWEFKVRFTDVTKAFDWVCGYGNFNPLDEDLTHYGLVLNPYDSTLYVQNYDSTFGLDPATGGRYKQNSFEDFHDWWYNKKTDPDWINKWKPLLTLSNDTWYHIKYWFGDEVHIVGGVAEWDAYETYVEITEIGGSTTQYGPFYTYKTTTQDWQRGISFRAITEDTPPGGHGTFNWRPNEFYIDDVCAWHDPAYQPGESLIDPLVEGVWTSDAIEFEEIQVVRDLWIEADEDGGTITCEYRIKLEEDDWGAWFEYDWANRPDLYVYCTAIQVRLTLHNPGNPVVNELTVRYLTAESIHIYRDGLVGVMRDTLRHGNFGPGDLKRFSAWEMSEKEQLRRVFQELCVQRRLLGGTAFNFTGKAHLTGLDQYGRDLNLVRGDLSEDEFRAQIAGSIIPKTGTVTSLLAWLKDSAGIEKGLGYLYAGNYPNPDWGEVFCPSQSSIDGQIDLMEWWKTGWILNEGYFADPPEDSTTVLGDTELNKYEYQVEMRGYEGYPIYPTLVYQTGFTGGAGYIQAGSPFVTRLYIWVEVNDVSGHPCTDGVQVRFEIPGESTYRQYLPTFTVSIGDETRVFGDTLESDYEPQRYNGISYYDGSTTHPLTEVFASPPSSDEFYVNYATRAIELANPVVTAGHAWQAGDELYLAYEAYGVKATGWVGVNVEQKVNVGDVISVGASAYDGGAYPSVGTELSFGVSTTGYLCVWHEELQADRDTLMQLLLDYRVCNTVPYLRMKGL